MHTTASSFSVTSMKIGIPFLPHQAPETRLATTHPECPGYLILGQPAQPVSGDNGLTTNWATYSDIIAAGFIRSNATDPIFYMAALSSSWSSHEYCHGLVYPEECDSASLSISGHIRKKQWKIWFIKPYEPTIMPVTSQ